MSLEDMLYDVLVDANTGEELDMLISEVEAALSSAEDRVVEDKDLWED